MKFVRYPFAAKLHEIWHGNFTDQELREKNEEFLEEFLQFGSETDDNLNCRTHIEYGKAENNKLGPSIRYGLKIKGTNILLSDVVNLLEDDEIFDWLSSKYPELSLAQIEAALRMTTMVLLAFERNPMYKNDDK